jgi:hypothetical protein
VRFLLWVPQDEKGISRYEWSRLARDVVVMTAEPRSYFYRSLAGYAHDRRHKVRLNLQAEYLPFIRTVCNTYARRQEKKTQCNKDSTKRLKKD